MSDVVWCDTQFVVVGSDGVILTSPDGVTWVAQDSGTDEGLSGVAWNGARMVATGGALLSSSDGVVWTAHDPQTSRYLRDVCWVGSAFMAVGSSGTVVMGDNDTWAAYQLAWQSIPYTRTLQAVTWNGERIVIAASIHILTSDDGESFTLLDTGGAEDVTWGAGVFVAVGDQGKILVSADGTTWDSRTTDESINPFTGVAWGAGTFMVVGEAARIYSSTDTTDWAPRWYSAASGWGTYTKDLSAVARGAGGYVAVGVNGVILRAADGSFWEPEDRGDRTSLADVAWGGGSYVAVGNRGLILTSPDGRAWTQRTSGVAGWLSGVTWTGSQLVAVGESGAIVTSPDGAQWTRQTSSTSQRLKDVVWTGSQLVAVGHGIILTSPDGSVWTSRSGAGDAWLSAVASSGAILLAVGRDTILTSANGQDWVSQAAGQDTRYEDITWAGTEFVAVGAEAQVGYSVDGVSWTTDSAPYRWYLDGILWDESQLIAVGWGGTVLRRECGRMTDVAYVAAAAHGAGAAGTEWRTDLELVNALNEQTTCSIELLAADQANMTPESASITVSPGRAVRLSDALEGTFAFDGAAALRITSSSGPIMITSRTFNQTEWGTYGQFVPALRLADAVGSGQRARLIQLGHDPTLQSGSRTNIGFVNATDAELTVEVALYDSRAVHLGTLTITLQAFEYRQVNRIFEHVTASVVEDGYALLQTSTPGGLFFAYASVVDNRTGDPVFIPATVPPPDPEAWYVPAAAHAPGSGGTSWRTDLEVHNVTATDATYSIEVLERDQDNTSPASVSFTLGPGLSARYGDVLDTMFGLTGAGAVRITSTTEVVIVTSRTYNLTDSGTYGQLVPGFAADQAISVGQTARIIQLSHDPSLDLASRTNIGFVNVTALHLTVEVSLFTADGTLLGVTIHEVEPYGFSQIDRIFERVTADPVDDGYASVRTTTADGAFLAYASVVDNRTGDPVFIPAETVD